jgi:hypothetical protein
MSNITRLRDAKLIVDALRTSEPDTTRHEFVLRLRRSFHEWGSLTSAMREALRPALIASSSC